MSTSRSKKAIVIVDDETSYIDLLAQLLSDNLNCPVFTFARPQDALDAFPQLDVGMIVTDFYMPQLNGFEFITQASAILPGVPFILITGHAIDLTAEEFAQFPALKSVLHKPFLWRRVATEILKFWPEEHPPIEHADLSLL
ncbi:MAG TPA: response regulator [Opitutaceae bacterium]|nr:response regulator [Opitutaceae bacterium]